MEYKIVEFNEATGQITIHVEGFPLFVVDLPIDENRNLPVGEELKAYLKGFIPTWHVERQEKLSGGIANAEEIRNLVTPLPQVKENTPSLEELEAQVRRQRNEALQQSDWTQVNDVNLTVAESNAWKAYRQALRDLPAQEGFPSNVIWPLPPNSSPR
jgi:hypothetical protein